MNYMLEQCFRTFIRTCPEEKGKLIHWVTEVGKIDGGTKAKRLEALMKFGVVPMNDSELKNLKDLEKEGLVLSVQGAAEERYSISMLGLVHVLRLEDNWAPDECISSLAKHMTTDIEKSLPQKQKLTAQELCIIFFLLVLSENDGELNLQEEIHAEECWSFFQNDFLATFVKYVEGDAVRKIIDKITSKGKKHTSMRGFMLNLAYLTSSKILVAKNHVYRFGDNQTPADYLPRLFAMSELKRDFLSRQNLANDLIALRDRAEVKCIVNDSYSRHFDSAIKSIQNI